MLNTSRSLLGKCGSVKASFRFSSNFLLTGGFSERTANADFANKQLLILDEKNSITYAQLNEQIGRYAALLNGKYKLGVGSLLRQNGCFLLFRKAIDCSRGRRKRRTLLRCTWRRCDLAPSTFH